MKLKIDLHVHTVHSKDGFSTVEDVVISAKKAGLDGIAITDHNTTKGFRDALMLGKKHELVVIPGCEIKTMDGDVLAIGIKKDIPAKMTVGQTIKKIHGLGGVAIAAHPYAEAAHRTKISRFLGCGFDAVETANSRSFFTNRKAEKRSDELGLPKTGGSDAHLARDVGNAYTIIESKKRTPESIIDAIKDGKTRPVFLRKTGLLSFAECAIKRAAGRYFSKIR